MHTIRLRGPWQLEALERWLPQRAGRHERSATGMPLRARMKMPADWSGAFGADFRGRVRFCRTFHKPTGLEGDERVWLVIEPPRSAGEVVLNDQPIGSVRVGRPPVRFDITAMLDDDNRLEIVVEHPLLDDSGAADDDGTSLPGGLIGEVRLEIEA
jgi:hypothetical protein